MESCFSLKSLCVAILLCDLQHICKTSQIPDLIYYYCITTFHRSQYFSKTQLSHRFCLAGTTVSWSKVDIVFSLSQVRLQWDRVHFQNHMVAGITLPAQAPYPTISSLPTRLQTQQVTQFTIGQHINRPPIYISAFPQKFLIVSSLMQLSRYFTILFSCQLFQTFSGKDMV